MPDVAVIPFPLPVPAVKTMQTAVDGFAASVNQAATTASEGLKRAAELAQAGAGAHLANLESMVAAGRFYQEGVKELAARAGEAARAQVAENVAHMQALRGVRSPKEALALQRRFACNTASQVLKAVTELTEEYFALTGDTLAPLTLRARAAADELKKLG